MIDRRGQFAEASLGVGDVPTEQILMTVIQSFSAEIFVGITTECDGRARKNVLEAPSEPRVLRLGRTQGFSDGVGNRQNSSSVSILISVG